MRARSLSSLALVFALPVLLAGATPAAADPLSDACFFMAGHLPRPEGALMFGVPDAFLDEFDTERVYRGCVHTLVGDWRQMPDDADLFRDLAAAALAQGWLLDNQADGPDGTSFRLRRGNLVCLVAGRWDGGDDMEPEAPTSPLFMATVKCGEG
jgi:hypothetical protein